MKKIMLSALSFLMAATLTTGTNLINSKAESSSDTITVAIASDGNFVRVNPLARSADTIEIREIEAGSEIYEVVMDNHNLLNRLGTTYEKLLKVSTGEFYGVNEIVLDPQNSNFESEMAIYGLSDVVKADLENYKELALNSPGMYEPAIVYTPNEPMMTRAGQITATNTYQGYNGETYKDEMVRYSASNSDYYSINTNVNKTYLERSLTIIAQVFLDNVASGVGSYAVTLSSLFGYTTYPPMDDIKIHQVRFNSELKHRRYTSIKQNGIYYTYGITEKSQFQFRHRLGSIYSSKEDTRVDPTKTVTSPQYDSGADRVAYNARSKGTVSIQYFKNYKVNNVLIPSVFSAPYDRP